VRHLPGDEYELVAHHAGTKPEVGAEATPADGSCGSRTPPRHTAISDVEIVLSAAKQRSMTTEVLGGM
jgi:hypothetical protein